MTQGNVQSLEQHYNVEHKDLIQIGLTLQASKNGNVAQGVIKDTLLTQLIVFGLINKGQLKRFQNDYEKELEQKLKRAKN